MGELRLGNLFEGEEERLKGAEVVFMEVVLPLEMHKRTQEMLSTKLRDGARLLTFTDNGRWRLDGPSPFHALPSGVPRGHEDKYATSWCPQGWPFYIWEVDRAREASVIRMTEEAETSLRKGFIALAAVLVFPPALAFVGVL